MEITQAYSTAEHAAHIAANMRESDAREVFASSGSTPLDALKTGLKVSDVCITTLVDDEPVAMGGISPISLLSGIGAPWLLATDKAEQYPMSFLRLSRRFVWRYVGSRYSRLENFVDARNETSIAWLEWLGFTINDPEPYGVYRLPFRRFYMEA